MQRWMDLALGILLGVALAGLAVWVAMPPRGTPIALSPPPPTPTPAPLWVDVEGAVVHPGVYALPAGSRVRDALQAAGGTTPQALTTALNLAARLEDGMRVYVPSQNDTLGTTPVTPTVAPLVTHGNTPRININTATLEELETLPHIGPVLAQRIIDYRTTYGPFQSVDELTAVKGIGPSLLDDIRDLITTGP